MAAANRTAGLNRPASTIARKTQPGTARLVILAAAASVNHTVAEPIRGWPDGGAWNAAIAAASPHRLSAAASTSARISKTVCWTKYGARPPAAASQTMCLGAPSALAMRPIPAASSPADTAAATQPAARGGTPAFIKPAISVKNNGKYRVPP